MTLQNRIWAARARQNMSQEEITEAHLVGKNVLVGEKIGRVTKQVGDNATGEVYEVELEDGTTVTTNSHELQLSDDGVGQGEPKNDDSIEYSHSQGPRTDSEAGMVNRYNEETEQVDEYITKDGTRRKVNGGDGRRVEEEEVEETYEDEEETADYDTFFKAALKKFGVEDPGDFKSEEDKKEFFNYIDKNFKGKKEKKESFSAEELAHFESVLKKNETLNLDEAQYKAKDKKGYERLMNDVTHAMSKGLVAKGGAVGDYKKFTVDIKFKDEKSRKKFEKMNNLN